MLSFCIESGETGKKEGEKDESCEVMSRLGGVLVAFAYVSLHLRPYRDEPSASRPIRADKHRRGQRVLTWVTSREHCAAAGFLHISIFYFYFFYYFSASFSTPESHQWCFYIFQGYTLMGNTQGKGERGGPAEEPVQEEAQLEGKN
jgi:hypothetical protein